MKVRELRQGLQQLESLLSGWRAKQAAADFSKLIELLTDYDDYTVSRFVQEVQRLRASSDRKPAGSKTPNENLITDYIEKLNSAQASPEGPLSTINMMTSDRKLRVGELNLILAQITGADRKFRSKKEAFQALERFYLEEARERNVFSSIERMIGRTDK